MTSKQEIPAGPEPHQRLVQSVFLCLAILVGATGYLAVVLICNSLVTSGDGITVLTPRFSTKRRRGFSNMMSGFILHDKYHYSPRL